MTGAEAFVMLMDMAEARLVQMPFLRSEKADEEIKALLIGADTILDMSGSWHPDDMIRNKMPVQVRRLDSLMTKAKVLKK